MTHFVLTLVLSTAAVRAYGSSDAATTQSQLIDSAAAKTIRASIVLMDKAYNRKDYAGMTAFFGPRYTETVGTEKIRVYTPAEYAEELRTSIGTLQQATQTTTIQSIVLKGHNAVVVESVSDVTVYKFGNSTTRVPGVYLVKTTWSETAAGWRETGDILPIPPTHP